MYEKQKIIELSNIPYLSRAGLVTKNLCWLQKIKLNYTKATRIGDILDAFLVHIGNSV